MARSRVGIFVGDAMHLPAGFSGALIGFFSPVVLLGLCYKSKRHGAYNLDPQGVRGAFEPILARYIRAAEFVVGLATGSIVLIVGSAVLHSNGHAGHLPWFFASPLVLLAFSVVWGITFMVWLIFSHEEYQHGNPHTALAYSLSQALGFGALLCFCVGYFWLVVCVTASF